MQLLGRSNWWMPGSLERWVPQLHVEGRAEMFLAARDATAPASAPADA